MLPNFLVIGARRAGTTWVHRNLSQHPQVFMPVQKEQHFFDQGYDKGTHLTSGEVRLVVGYLNKGCGSFSQRTAPE